MMTGYEAPALVLILRWLLSSGAQAQAPQAAPEKAAPEKAAPEPQGAGENRWPRTVPKGGEVPITRTWPAASGGADAWRRARYASLVAWLRGPAKLSPAELEQARDIAISALAHWDLEAASGTAEYNGNAGGIGARPGDRYFASKDAQSTPPKAMAFAAYDDPTQFQRDYFGVLALSRYADALRLLLTDPRSTAWIRALRKGGYYGADENVVAKAYDARRLLVVKALVGVT